MANDSDDSHPAPANDAPGGPNEGESGYPAGRVGGYAGRDERVGVERADDDMRLGRDFDPDSGDRTSRGPLRGPSDEGWPVEPGGHDGAEFRESERTAPGQLGDEEAKDAAAASSGAIDSPPEKDGSPASVGIAPPKDA